MLRRAFKTICIELKVGDTLSHLLLGHALEGVSRKYIAKIILTSGQAFRSEQARWRNIDSATRQREASGKVGARFYRFVELQSQQDRHGTSVLICD